MPSRVPRGLSQRDIVALFLLLVVVKNVNVIMAVIIMAVVVIVVSEDVDRSVPLKIRAVRLFCKVDHWDMLVQFQFKIQVNFHQVLALVVIVAVLVVVVVVVAALLPRWPDMPLLSALGSLRGRSSALEDHFDELVVLVHTVADAQVLLLT